MTGVARELAEVFGVGELVRISPVARGAMGAVWELRTAEGVFAAKELFWFDGEVDSVLPEVAFRAACAESGVPSPAPLAAANGKYVVRLGSRWWRLYEWADGVAPGPQDAEATAWLAAQMGVIHAIDWPGGSTEVVPWYHRVDVDWPALVLEAKHARVEWAERLDQLQPRLAELNSIVNTTPIGDQVWCHRDLRNSNVLRSGPNTLLVDWDNAGQLAPHRELGALLMPYLHSPADLRQIADAYRTAGGPGRIDDPSGFATGLAISLNFLHGQASAAMDDAVAEQHRTFAAQQVVDLLDTLPTLELLEQAATTIRST
ncbi:phosphotransferase [Kribbella sp. NBC_00382]|uniref:phosphotransferase enzyme family protein n=1 Tax=Kribbella sp. NBC_00382 TaxID=2975967 RepID=UPI002E1E194F